MQRVLIDGIWVDAQSALLHQIENPANLAVLGTVADCGTEDVARAARAAGRARMDWCGLAANDKAAAVARIAAGVRERAGAIARLLTQESGKPACEACDEVATTADRFTRLAMQIPDCAPAQIDRAGVAVVAVLASFDRPLAGFAGALAAALAADEAVICKPPRENPLSTLLLAETFEVLPPGLVNVLTGGAGTAAALVDAEGVDRVVCCGPRSRHEAIAAAAIARGKALGLERGVITPIVVLGDADLELAAAGAAWAGLHNAGQACGARARIFVERHAAAAFADQLHQYVAFLEVGDPLKPDTDLGPVISHLAVRSAEEQVARALQDGARLKLGGRSFSPWGLPGHFFQPTILTEPHRGGLAARAEILAPVVAITSFAGTAELIQELGEQLTGAVQVYAGDAAAAARLMASVWPGRADGLEHVTARDRAWFPYRDRAPPRADRTT